jgi:hypothetical protein
VNLALGGLAEGDDSRVQAMDEGSNGYEIQSTLLTDIQTIFHYLLPVMKAFWLFMILKLRFGRF